jgi:hypothetical protein
MWIRMLILWFSGTSEARERAIGTEKRQFRGEQRRDGGYHRQAVSSTALLRLPGRPAGGLAA